MTTASIAKPVALRRYRLPYVLAILFAAVVLVSGINPVMPADWWLENGLVFLFIACLVVGYRWLALSDLSYLLIFFYLCMHEWGAHYRYALDPLGEWLKQLFHAARNDFDRITHFAFGALLAYPQCEVLVRKAKVSGWWAFSLPVLTTAGFSCIYEILEMAAFRLASPETGEAFIALQGDSWDSQNDMLVAFIGAIVAMSITAAVRARKARIPAAFVAR